MGLQRECSASDLFEWRDCCSIATYKITEPCKRTQLWSLVRSHIFYICKPVLNTYILIHHFGNFLVNRIWKHDDFCSATTSTRTFKETNKCGINNVPDWKHCVRMNNPQQLLQRNNNRFTKCLGNIGQTLEKYVQHYSIPWLFLSLMI